MPEIDNEPDNNVPVISESQVLSKVDRNGGQLAVKEQLPSFRETAAYRMLVWFALFGGVSAVLTMIIFAVLSVRDPKNAAAHLELCQKMFQGIITTLGLPAIFSYVLGYLFGQQKNTGSPDGK